jgi:steroid delta-isomerase-like uncharacterized protein
MKQLLKTSFLLVALIYSSTCVSQTADQNKATARLYIEECVNKRKLELIDQIFADSFRVHILLDSTQSISTRKALKDFLSSLFDAFPDIHYTVGDIIGGANRVAMRVSFSGTHKKDFLGIKANNNKVNYASEIFFFRFENGKVVEDWVQLDLYNLFKKMKGGE